MSDVVDIQGIFNINSFYDDRGRIRLIQNFINVLIYFCVNLRVIIYPKVNLIEDDNAQSLRVNSIFNE